MKKTILIAIVLVFSATLLRAQEKSQMTYPMLGEDAPSFIAESTLGTMNFPEDYNLKWKILFSHPADFTPVCTSEILELAAAQKDFDKLGVKLVVVSVDNLENHIEWQRNMEAIRYKDRDPQKIYFPLVSDPNLKIAKEYGMIHPSSSDTKDVRGVFIIDPKNKIRAIFYYPMNIGRNLGEVERTIVALQTADKQEVLIPGNWLPGDDVLLPYPVSTAEAGKAAKHEDSDHYQLNWYMHFKKGAK